MSSTMKVFLLLAVMVCISSALKLEEQCLCPRVRNRLISKSDIQDIQIYQVTIFCNRVEIVITNNNGLRYCLNPKLKAVQRLMTSIMKLRPNNSTATPAEVTPTPLTVGLT